MTVPELLAVYDNFTRFILALSLQMNFDEICIGRMAYYIIYIVNLDVIKNV